MKFNLDRAFNTFFELPCRNYFGISNKEVFGLIFGSVGYRFSFPHYDALEFD
jgi:hypothetical protein